MAHFSFDTSTVEKRENNFELLPARNYIMQVIDSQIVPLKPKDGNPSAGDALKLTCEVLEEGYKGRRIWVNLNIRHTNSQTEQIAQQHLRKLCEAVGIARMSDTAELHNKPFEGVVKIRVSKNPQYQDQNEVVAYKALNGAAPAPGFRAPAANSGGSAAPAAAGGSAPPWQRGKAAA